MLDNILSNINNVFNKFGGKVFSNHNKSSEYNSSNIDSKSNNNISNINSNNKSSINNINNENIETSISESTNECIGYSSNNNNIINIDDINYPTGMEIDDAELRRSKGKTFSKTYFIKNKNVKVNLRRYKRKSLNKVPAKFSTANPFNRIKQLSFLSIKQKKHHEGRIITKRDVKSDSKSFSVTFVPLSPGKIKTFRITNFHIKFAVIWILFLIVSIYSLSTFITTYNENKLLKASIDAITSKTAEQIALLTEKYNKISELLEEGEKTNIDITELSAKYREIIEKYVDGRITGSIASRSGNRTDSTFIKDVKELNDILNELSEINSSKEELMVDLSDIEEKLRSYIDSLPTQWPVKASISSRFGTRRDPITGRIAYHKGIDLAANYGTNIKAAGAGKVIHVGSYNELGLAVIIDHGNGIKTVYGHTSKILVKKGDMVTKDTIIAKVGSSGRSTGSHLHFEIRINDTPVDPLIYLESQK